MKLSKVVMIMNDIIHIAMFIIMLKLKNNFNIMYTFFDK